MSTNKPRIQAYVESYLYSQFEEERATWDVSQSQALEKILAERYHFSSAKEKSSVQYDIEMIHRTLSVFRERISKLESALEVDNEIRAVSSQEVNLFIDELPLPSELPGELDAEPQLVTDELPSESQLVTDDLPGELDAEPQLVTDELPSESQLVTDDLPGELDAEPQLVTDELPSESQLVTDDLPGELDAEPQLVTDELPSESQLVTDDLPGELDAEPQLVTDELPSELTKLIICEIDREAQSIKYWAGSKLGFVSSLTHAKRYKSPNMTQRPMHGIIADSRYDYFKKQPGRFKLKFNSLDFFLKNPHYNPNFKYGLW